MRSLGVVCALLMLSAGCGGDDTTADSPPVRVADGASDLATGTASDSSLEATAGETTTPEVEASSVVVVDVAPCDLVTADEIAAAIGLAVVAVDDDPVLPPNGCVFDLGVSATVFVSVDDGQGRMTGPASLFDGYMADVGESAELISELGAAAVYSSQFRTLAVDAGAGRYFAVGLSGGYPGELAEPHDALVALATAAMARL